MSLKPAETLQGLKLHRIPEALSSCMPQKPAETLSGEIENFANRQAFGLPQIEPQTG